MNQDEFLEHLWSNVIDRDDGPIEFAAGGSGPRRVPTSVHGDLRLVARHARYAAVVDWCWAFDEAGLPPAAWLMARNGSRWRRLADPGPGESVFDTIGQRPPPGAPFAEEYDLMDRLSAAGVTDADIRGVIHRSRRAALDAVLGTLREHAFGPDDLAGLHEWLPFPPSERKPHPEARTGAPAPILRIRHSHGIAFSPDGSRVVAARGGAITDLDSGEPLATCGLLANTGHVAWSPDGRWIAATNTSGKIALCDARTGARIHVLAMTCEGGGAVFSRDGTRVYGGDWGGFVFAWDVATGREVRRVDLRSTMVTSVTWARDVDGLDVIANHRFDPAAPDPRPDVLVTLTGTLDETGRRIELPNRTSDVVWDLDGDRALIVGHEWIARMDRTGAVSEERRVPGARALACSPDGRWYALTHEAGFRIGPTDDLSRASEVALRYPSNRAAFSPDSKRVALATWEAGEVWELDRLIPA